MTKQRRYVTFRNWDHCYVVSRPNMSMMHTTELPPTVEVRTVYHDGKGYFVRRLGHRHRVVRTPTGTFESLGVEVYR